MKRRAGRSVRELHLTHNGGAMQPATSQIAPGEPTSESVTGRGFFRILSFFDIAEAIDLDNLHALLGPEAAPRSPGFVHLTPEYAQAQNQPLLESVEPVALPSGEKLEAKIKYYWFGVASVELSAPFRSPFDSPCRQSYRWMNAPEVEKAAEVLLR